jgi:hypothetical protein
VCSRWRFFFVPGQPWFDYESNTPTYHINHASLLLSTHSITSTILPASLRSHLQYAQHHRPMLLYRQRPVSQCLVRLQPLNNDRHEARRRRKRTIPHKRLRHARPNPPSFHATPAFHTPFDLVATLTLPKPALCYCLTHCIAARSCGFIARRRGLRKSLNLLNKRLHLQLKARIESTLSVSLLRLE